MLQMKQDSTLRNTVRLATPMLRQIRRSILSGALVLGVVACDPNRTEINDYSGFASYQFAQRPGLGFCADPSAVFTVSIERRSPEEFDFRASVLRSSSADTDECPSGIQSSDGCMIVEALPSRFLSGTEIARMNSAFSALKIHPEPDPRCEVLGIDPCRIEQHSWDDKSHNDYICSADRLSTEQAGSLQHLLSDLLAAKDK